MKQISSQGGAVRKEWWFSSDSRTSLNEKEGARGGEERLRTTSWLGGDRKRAVKVDQEED